MNQASGRVSVKDIRNTQTVTVGNRNEEKGNGREGGYETRETSKEDG